MTHMRRLTRCVSLANTSRGRPTLPHFFPAHPSSPAGALHTYLSPHDVGLACMPSSATPYLLPTLVHTHSGALHTSLSPNDVVATPSGNLPVNVTMVFCTVDGGKQYVLRYRREAREVHLQLVALIRSTLLQVGGLGVGNV